jgi:hypothetical protein
MSVKVECGTCGREVATWSFTVYLRPHKHSGEWCTGGWRTTSQQDIRSVCFCGRNPLGHTLRQHAELWPLNFGEHVRSTG